MTEKQALQLHQRGLRRLELLRLMSKYRVNCAELAEMFEGYIAKGIKMKARPIIFSSRMVRALLDGMKYKTRRIIKHQPYQSEYEPDLFHVTGELKSSVTVNGVKIKKGELYSSTVSRDGLIKTCQYGQPGDLLWVRETHAIVPRTAYLHSEGVQQTVCQHDDYYAAIYRSGWDRSGHIRWRPSIHMHRWASRLTLRIKDVRIERVQEISEEECFMEGIDTDSFFYLEGERFQSAGSPCNPARYAFMHLWDDIHGHGEWSKNPLVWVLSFDVIRANVDQVIKDMAA